MSSVNRVLFLPSLSVHALFPFFCLAVSVRTFSMLLSGNDVKKSILTSSFIVQGCFRFLTIQYGNCRALCLYVERDFQIIEFSTPWWLVFVLINHG